jgi:hypothetical protein
MPDLHHLHHLRNLHTGIGTILIDAPGDLCAGCGTWANQTEVTAAPWTR